jgi:type II secretory pathway component PulF
VLHIADAAHAMFVPLLASVAVLMMAWRAWVGTDAGRVQWHRVLLAVPGLGAIRRGAATARMAHSLSALLESGVPIATAMTFAARATGDAELQARLADARTRGSAGQSLSHALDETRASSQTSIRLVRAGEETGRLPSMLGHVAKIEQKRVDEIVRTGIRMLEPILLLTFASVVALVAAALLQAIYSVRPNV